MTQGEAKLFESDMILFPVKKDEETPVAEIETEVVEVKKRTLTVDVNKRFARLRKSIRKRSASIF
jgi:hypothetical protein